MHLDYYNPIVNFFYKITDGVIDKLFMGKRLIVGVIDLSPLVFLLILNMVVPLVLRQIYLIVIRLIA